MPLASVLMLQETREVISQHLAFVKWKDSAFSTEQLKHPRWLLGARPKNTIEAFQEVLTVTPMAQVMLMELHIATFNEATRRVRPSVRGRLRPTPETFEKMVDFACVFAALRKAAKGATSDKEVDGKLVTAFMARCLACKIVSYCHCVCRVLWCAVFKLEFVINMSSTFLSFGKPRDYVVDIEAVIASKNPAFRLSSLSVWEDIISPPTLPKVLEDTSGADILEVTQKALDAKFHEVKIKLAADCETMSKFNSEQRKFQSKNHVAKVMHEKTQNETGKQLLS